MSGFIPHELSYFADSLVEINMAGNSILGSIPSFFEKLSNLDTIGLNDNCLSGSIPEFFSEMTNLAMLVLHNNVNLYGSLNGLCEGTEFKNDGMITMLSDCECPINPISSLECDCCHHCCNRDTFQCYNMNGDQGVSSSYSLETSPNGIPKSFETTCLSKKSRLWIEKECPCTIPIDDVAQCTTNCAAEGAIRNNQNSTA